MRVRVRARACVRVRVCLYVSSCVCMLNIQPFPFRMQLYAQWDCPLINTHSASVTRSLARTTDQDRVLCTDDSTERSKQANNLSYLCPSLWHEECHHHLTLPRVVRLGRSAPAAAASVAAATDRTECWGVRNHRGRCCCCSILLPDHSSTTRLHAA